MIDILLGRKLTPPQFKQTGKSAIFLQLDACISQSHQYKNVITSFPIENGLDVTDHIRQEPDQFIIEGIVTNSPVQYLSFATSSSPSQVGDFKSVVNSGKDRVLTAYEALLMMSGRKIVKMPGTVTSNFVNYVIESKPMLIDISTQLRVFNDMIFEDLQFDFDNKTGDALPFKATCKRVRKINVSSVNVNYTVTRLYGAAGTDDQTTSENKGNQNTIEPTSSHKSALKAAADSKGLANGTGAFMSNLFNF